MSVLELLLRWKGLVTFCEQFVWIDRVGDCLVLEDLDLWLHAVDDDDDVATEVMTSSWEACVVTLGQLMKQRWSRMANGVLLQIVEVYVASLLLARLCSVF